MRMNIYTRKNNTSVGKGKSKSKAKGDVQPRTGQKVPDVE